MFSKKVREANPTTTLSDKVLCHKDLMRYASASKKRGMLTKNTSGDESN